MSEHRHLVQITFTPEEAIVLCAAWAAMDALMTGDEVRAVDNLLTANMLGVKHSASVISLREKLLKSLDAVDQSLKDRIAGVF